MLYFSGTGNSKFIAESFCRKMEETCRSIEGKIDFAKLIAEEEIIGICYPVRLAGAAGYAGICRRAHRTAERQEIDCVLYTNVFFRRRRKGIHRHLHNVL